MTHEDFIIENGVLKKYVGRGGDITIPPGVHTIASGAFAGARRIRRVTIPEGVTTLEEFAFFRCRGITGAVIAGSVKRIGSGCFKECPDLMRVTLCEGVREIGAEAFSGCVGLLGVELPESLERLEEECFYRCERLEAAILKNSVVSIGDHAFRSCLNLKDVRIPDGVRRVGAYAFDGCLSLQGAAFCEGIYLGCPENPFVLLWNCIGYWTSCPTIHKDTRIIGCRAFCEADSMVRASIPAGVRQIGDYAFLRCLSLKRLDLPPGLCEIGKCAFYDCRLLEELNVPDGTSVIGAEAFGRCNSLNKIRLPEALVEACRQNGVFEGCRTAAAFRYEKRSDDRFESAVSFFLYGGEERDARAIAVYAHRMREKLLLRLTVENDPAAVSELFSCCADRPLSIGSLEAALSVPENGAAMTALLLQYRRERYSPEEEEEFLADRAEKELGLRERSLAEWRKIFTVSKTGDGYILKKYKGRDVSVVVPGEIAGVPVKGLETTFAGNDTLEEVYVSPGVTRVGSRTFDHCRRLRTVLLPDTIKSVGHASFSSCSALEGIALPEGLEVIGEDAFSFCTSLDQVRFPASLRVIKTGAFAGSALKSVELPKDLAELGDGAFIHCGSLISAAIPVRAAIGNEVFTGCSALERMTAAGSGGRYQVAGDCLIDTVEKKLISGCRNSVLPCDGSLRVIGEAAFARSEITQINLPDGVETVENHAFRNCRKLERVTLPASVVWIGDCAFDGCDALEEIVFYGSCQRYRGLFRVRLPDNGKLRVIFKKP